MEIDVSARRRRAVLTDVMFARLNLQVVWRFASALAVPESWAADPPYGDDLKGCVSRGSKLICVVSLRFRAWRAKHKRTPRILDAFIFDAWGIGPLG